MRNWNILTDGRNIWLDWLPAYLWGIETPFNHIIFHGETCYQPTYEELKLPNKTIYVREEDLLPAYLWGIETCGRELQPVHAMWLPAYLWGIETNDKGKKQHEVAGYQPTYEELKPTKNLIYPLDNKLPAYLWGIETKSG